MNNEQREFSEYQIVENYVYLDFEGVSVTKLRKND